MTSPKPPSIDEVKLHYQEKNLEDLYKLSVRCHSFLLAESHITAEFEGYSMRQHKDNEAKKVRPIRESLFISEDFDSWKDSLEDLLARPCPKASSTHRLNQRKLIYTIQQSVGGYLDLIAKSDSDVQQARKVAGEFFQALIGQIFAQQYAVSSGNISFNIKEAGGANEKLKKAIEDVPAQEKLRLSFDHLIRPMDHQIEDNSDLEPPCVVCGVKTTTKDRGNMFYVDKFLYTATHLHRPSFIAVVLNDVQRKQSKGKTTGISYTFLSGHNRLYRYVMEPLDGYYYVDPPPPVVKEMEEGDSNMYTIDKMLNDDFPAWLQNSDG